jgi:hypothetical protein
VASEEKKAAAKRRRKRLPALPLHKLPNQQSIVDQARRYAPACVRALADEVANNSGAARVSAANSLLERGYGKVGQPIEVTGKAGGPVEIELPERVRELIEAVLP